MMNANKKFATVRSGGIVFKIVIALAVALACFMLIDLTSQEPKLAHLTNTIAGQTKVRNDGSGNVERPQQKPPVQVDTQAGAAAAAEDQQLQPEEPAEINGHAEPEGPEESGEQLDVEKPAPTDKPKLPLHPTMVPRQTPWLETSVHRSICTNTCPTAHDGVCDDGRQQQTNPEIDYSTVTCDLGTDCGDCGPFEFSGPKFALDWAPIAETRAKGITVRVKRAVFDDLERPSFLFAYTDPAQDVDVSAHMQAHNMVERHISQVWYHVLKEGCGLDSTNPALVVDVGGNFGWFSLLSASMGCHVVSWEPVPYFAAFFKYSLLANNMTSMVELRENIVGEEQGKKLTIVVPNRGIWGTAGVGGANIDSNIQNDGEYDRIEKETDRVDNVIAEEVLIMKADVEGFETSVLAGAKRLFDRHNVWNVVMEYSPGVAERSRDWDDFRRNPIMLLDLMQRGYTIIHLNQPPRQQFGMPLMDMPYVPLKGLLLDVRDADALKAGTLGCPPPELKDRPFMPRCNDLPEGLDPRSFRASFGHNTNVWAFKRKPGTSDLTPPYLTIGGPSAVFPLDFDTTQNYFTPHDFGVQMRRCSDMPVQAQVSSRCRCREPEACGELDAAVEQAAKEGKFARSEDPVTLHF